MVCYERKNTKGVILEQKRNKDCWGWQISKGLEMTISKSWAIFFFFKIHERWRSSFKMQIRNLKASPNLDLCKNSRILLKVHLQFSFFLHITIVLFQFIFKLIAFVFQETQFPILSRYQSNIAAFYNFKQGLFYQNSVISFSKIESIVRFWWGA